MRSRRAILYVPGSDPHKMEKGASSAVDSVALDLEDGVAENRKDDARGLIQKALMNLDFEGAERLVRVNAFATGRTEADLQAVLAGRPDGIILPKVEDAAQVRRLETIVQESEAQIGGAKRQISLLVQIENALGLLNLQEICQASPLLEALIFGAEDFCASIGATRTAAGTEVLYARSAVVVAAAAFGLQAIDMVQINFKDLVKLEAESKQGADMGFSGKQIIHPAQIAPVQQAYTPTTEEITWAREVVAAARKYQTQGKGAFAFGDLAVDAPLVKQAENLLARARAAGVLSQT
ncbi:MAG: CoA ester lyase [Anaerolineaceae bacterium]